MSKVTMLARIEALQSEFESLGVRSKDLPHLAHYLSHLDEANSRINLVSRKLTPEQLVTDHLYDSLLPLPFFPKVDKVIDLGSGGGFPAIPLAILFPSVMFLLVEKSPVKRRFLHSLTDLCPNLRIFDRYENLPSHDSESLIVARAFKPIKGILEITRSHLNCRGRYMLYKGKQTKIEEELVHARSFLRGHSVVVQRLRSPLNDFQRHLVWIASSLCPEVRDKKSGVCWI